MTKNVYACAPDQELPAALRTMQSKKVRRLPVIDGHGKLVGILSMDDVVLRSEDRKAEKRPELDYGRTIKTLKAIYERSTPKKELSART
jgi:CBS domain-containing protein